MSLLSSSEGFPVHPLRTTTEPPRRSWPARRSSADSLSSTGGVVLQPGLGRAADVWGYPVTFVASAVFQACALPFLRLAQRLAVPQDLAQREPGPASPAV